MGAPVYAVDDPADLDVEKAAFEIFPLLTGTDNSVLRREYGSALADIIGGPGAFRKYAVGNSGDLASKRAHLLEVFRENVRLLVAKTWVDGKDEAKKAEALALLEAFVGMINAEDYANAIAAFVRVSDSVATLLFGEDPREAGFMEYVFRIDPRLGIFYWYSDQLRAQARVDEDLAQIELLVGVYALASF
ncbi:MAG: hypothetical protein KKA67_00825 [Spirochaetes bacterium]|nr:hypothetical protein [Spirochaetota bacterium]MBU1080674.1 hypothetical protein [Spirochaetota bacterium]